MTSWDKTLYASSTGEDVSTCPVVVWSWLNDDGTAIDPAVFTDDSSGLLVQTDDGNKAATYSLELQAWFTGDETTKDQISF